MSAATASHPQSYFAQADAREVQMTSFDGTVLRGWYVKPRNDNGSVVVMLHGLSDNRLGAAGFSPIFLSAGYRILLPDSRAHGESGGAIATFGIKEAQDMHDWVTWLEQQDRQECVFGFGESMGAAMLLQSLPSEPRFCAAVAESPFATFQEAAYERIGEYFGAGPQWFGRTVGRPIVWFAELYSRVRYGVDLMAANPSQAAARSRAPILLIHGMSDSNLLPRNSEEIAQACRRANRGDVELWLVPNAHHTGAYGTVPEQFETRVLGWFQAHRSAK